MRWTGKEARVLREIALRMSVRSFASHTGLSAFSISDMEAKGQRAQLRPSTQKILDDALAAAPEPAQQRFRAALGSAVLGSTSLDAGDNRTETISHTGLPAAGLGEPVGMPLLSDVERGSDGIPELLVEPAADPPAIGRHDGTNGVPFQEFAMAAGDSAGFVRRAGITVSVELLDQLRSEVDQLAADYLRRPPFAVFADISALRREVFSVLDHHVPARHLSELYVCAGQLTALLAHASADLGQRIVAEAHARTAWLCAELAGHDPLRAYVRWVQANIAYWAGQYRQAAEIAAGGRRHANSGSAMLRLASQEARAWAAHGDHQAVEEVLTTARTERDRLPDESGEVGAFRFSRGKAAYYAAEAWLAVGGETSARRARDDAEEAYALLTAEPAPCRELQAAAQLDLAIARVTLGEIDGATSVLASVLTLPSERRTVPVTQRAVQVNHALSDRHVARSSVSADLAEQIRLFLAYPAMREVTN